MFADFTDDALVADLTQAATSVVVGPGLGNDGTSLRILKNVFAHTTEKQNVIIDGSAITLMAMGKAEQPQGNIIYTPHEMEWQRLSGIKIGDQTEDKNKAAQEKTRCYRCLKEAPHRNLY